MKIILLVFLTVSCSKLLVRNEPNYSPTDKKIYQCILRLVEKNGIKAKIASAICTNIYKREE